MQTANVKDKNSISEKNQKLSKVHEAIREAKRAGNNGELTKLNASKKALEQSIHKQRKQFAWQEIGVYAIFLIAFLGLSSLTWGVLPFNLKYTEGVVSSSPVKKLRYQGRYSGFSRFTSPGDFIYTVNVRQQSSIRDFEVSTSQPNVRLGDKVALRVSRISFLSWAPAAVEVNDNNRIKNNTIIFAVSLIFITLSAFGVIKVLKSM